MTHSKELSDMVVDEKGRLFEFDSMAGMGNEYQLAGIIDTGEQYGGKTVDDYKQTGWKIKSTKFVQLRNLNWVRKATNQEQYFK